MGRARIAAAGPRRGARRRARATARFCCRRAPGAAPAETSCGRPLRGRAREDVMQRHSVVWAVLAASSLALVAERDASACGGCFVPPAENDSDITDERMLLSVSPQQSTLYDQIRYAG